MLWTTWQGFNETAVDLDLGYRGLGYNLSKMTHVVTDPPLKNCHLLWAFQTQAQRWYQSPISHEVAVALDIFDGRDQQWETVAWLYLRDRNVSLASPQLSNAIATTSFNDLHRAVTLNTISSSTNKGISKFNWINPDFHNIPSAQPVDRSGCWYMVTQSIARIAIYPGYILAGDERRYDDDTAHLSFIWKRVEQAVARVKWEDVKASFTYMISYMDSRRIYIETVGDFATPGGNSSLSLYGSVSLRKYPLPPKPSPQVS